MTDLEKLIDLTANLSDEQLRLILIIQVSNFICSPVFNGYRINKNFDIRIIVDELINYIKTGEKNQSNNSSNNIDFISSLLKTFYLK